MRVRRALLTAGLLMLAACQEQPVAPDPSFSRQPPPPPPPPADPAIAYSQDDGLWVMNSDGTNKTRLLRFDYGGWNAYFPSWSPDGTKLAVSIYVSGQGWGIYTVGRDGSGLKLLVTLPSGFWEMPAWSPVRAPDGFYWIAYGTDPPPYPPEDNLGALDIYMVREDGAAVVRLTDTPYTSEDYLSWASTGDRLAAKVTEWDPATGASTELGILVYPFDWSSMSLGAPVNATPPGSPLAGIAGRPDWARTSDRIAVDAGGDIWVIALGDLAHPVQLTATPDRGEAYPTWSPDDSRIAFHGTSAISRFATLSSMRSDGSDLKTLGPTAQKSNVAIPRMPDWRRNP